MSTKTSHQRKSKGSIGRKIEKWKRLEVWRGFIQWWFGNVPHQYFKFKRNRDGSGQKFPYAKTDEELRLVKVKNREHLNTYSHYYFGKNPDVDPEEMKKSDSTSKYVHVECRRWTYFLTLKNNRKRKLKWKTVAISFESFNLSYLSSTVLVCYLSWLKTENSWTSRRAGLMKIA